MRAKIVRLEISVKKKQNSGAREQKSGARSQKPEYKAETALTDSVLFSSDS
jgi:hypothetical protein